MKWLILQSAGEHDGRDGWTPNHYMRECLSWQHALNRHEQDADVYGPGHVPYSAPIDTTGYDCILVLEQYKTAWVHRILGAFEGLKILWAIDLHAGARQQLLRLVPEVNLVLHATRSLMPPVENRFPGQKHVWFPNCADKRWFNPGTAAFHPKIRDVLFVGSIPRHSRKLWIQDMQKRLGMEYLFATGVDMVNAVRSAKVHMNQSIGPDVNYRCFETLGLGTCLCTNYVKEMDELGFESGRNCLMYRNSDDAERLVKQVLEDGSWQSIAVEGSRLFEQHTYFERAGRLITLVSEQR